MRLRLFALLTVAIGSASLALAQAPGGAPRPGAVETKPLPPPGETAPPPPAAPPSQPAPPPASPPAAAPGTTARPTLVPEPGDQSEVAEVTLTAKPAVVISGTSSTDGLREGPPRHREARARAVAGRHRPGRAAFRDFPAVQR